jgi:hypothetical protein
MRHAGFLSQTNHLPARNHSMRARLIRTAIREQRKKKSGEEQVPKWIFSLSLQKRPRRLPKSPQRGWWYNHPQGGVAATSLRSEPFQRFNIRGPNPVETVRSRPVHSITSMNRRVSQSRFVITCITSCSYSRSRSLRRTHRTRSGQQIAERSLQ